MSNQVQKAIDELTALCTQAVRESDVRDVARIAYLQAQMCQAALSALVEMLTLAGTLPEGPWLKVLERGYVNQRRALIEQGSSILTPSVGH